MNARNETEFVDLSDARAGAIKVASKYGMTITIWRLEPSGRFLVNNWKEPKLANAVFVEKHVGTPEKDPHHGPITALVREKT